jgi:hypothetical protein
MATHWGTAGLVKVGSITIAEIVSFKFTQSVDPVDDTAMRDAWRTHIAGSGIKKWSGSLECHFDETDATGQGALVAGASVTLTFLPEGDTTGDVSFSGLCTITEVGVDVPMEGSTIRRSFTFDGNGPLATGTVP